MKAQKQRKIRKINKTLAVAAVLFLLTALAAVFHLKTRENVAEGTILVTIGDVEKCLKFSELSYIPVTGVRLNGKGEEISVDASGILLKDVVHMVSDAEYDTVVVMADDSYQAELSFDEVEKENTAFLIAEDEEQLRLVVFGDSNSKRSVSDVVQIIAK